MKFPNKITPYNNSSFPKFIIIMDTLKNGDLPSAILYENIKKKIPSYNEFLEILTCLYALNKVILTELEELHLC